MDSDDTTDEGTKKRGLEDSFSIFSKSKRIQRTPQKVKDQDDKLERVVEMLANLTKDLEMLTKEVKGIRTEQNEYRQEIRELQAENKKIKEENSNLKQKIADVELRLDQIERKSRKNNIVIQGMEIKTQDQNEIKGVIEDFMKRALNVEIDVKRATNIGKKVCLVELRNTTDKMLVMKNKNKLKDIREPRIFINDDMSKTEREIQGRIRNKAKEEKTKGKNVKVGFQKITINGEEWKLNVDTNNFEKTYKQQGLQKN